MFLFLRRNDVQSYYTMEFINQEASERPTEKRRRKSKALLIVLPIAWFLTIVVTAAVTFMLTKILTNVYQDPLIGALNETVDVIREHYYFYDQDETELTNKALKSVIGSTGDAYAYYYSAEEYAELTKQNEGTFVGIGIMTMMEDDGRVRIIDVYDNTPASEADIHPNDLLIKINGVSYEGLDLSSFLANLIAEEGVENELTLLRDETEITCKVIPREVHTPTVFSKMLTDTIGYIRISTFHGTCVEETDKALKDLKASGMESLVLDLRDNLGGSLYDALDIADMFLPKDHIITSLRSRTDEEQKFYTKTDGIDLPMVLLVNGNSASASELVSGALKDYDVAHLIGVKTFGKGIVQSYYSVPQTKGMLKITTEAYYTPNGICVHGAGIEPDETVELSEDAYRYSISVLPFELDLQLQAAIAYLEKN